MLFHVPWYNSNKAHQGAGDDMMAAMEPLLYAASVDLVIAGHVHAYERSVCHMDFFIFHYLLLMCILFIFFKNCYVYSVLLMYLHLAI